MGTTVGRRERLFTTVSEYHHLACDGILNGDDRVELINGKIYLMSPIGSRHAECVTPPHRVSVFPGIPAGTSEYSESGPIEVADTSLELDQEVKAKLYATAGVRELWVIALNDECIHVYRNPSPTGYAAQETVERGARLEILALPDSGSFSVDAILG